MTIKLDIFKAYDRLEWSFLEIMMQKLGFDDLWIYKIKTCVTTVSYSTLVNGKPGLIIKPSKSIQQGNTISSYLYLNCVEGLSMLLNAAKNSS